MGTIKGRDEQKGNEERKILSAAGSLFVSLLCEKKIDGSTNEPAHDLRFNREQKRE